MQLFYLLFLVQLLTFPFTTITAQNNYQQFIPLSYNELDSLMEIEDNKGAFDKAIPYMQAGREKAKLEFGEQDPIFASYTSDLAFFYVQIGQYEKAEPLFLQFRDIQKKTVGVEHTDYATALNNLANLFQKMGDFEKALPLFIQTKNIQEKALGKAHPSFAIALNNLAMSYREMGNIDQAIPFSIQSNQIIEKVVGTSHPEYAQSLNNLASLYKDIGNLDRAFPLFLQALSIQEKTLGETHPHVAFSLNNLANLYQSIEKLDQALALFIQAKNIRKNTLGIEHPFFATSLITLAGLYQKTGDFEQALTLSIQAKNIQEKALGKAHPSFAMSLHNLAGLYRIMGQPKTALPLYLQAIAIQEKSLGTEHPDFLKSLINLAKLQMILGDFEESWKYLLQVIQTTSGITTKNISTAWVDSLANAEYLSTQHLERLIAVLKPLDQLLEKNNAIQLKNEPNSLTPKAQQILVADLAIKLLNKFQHSVSNDKDKLRMLAQSGTWLHQSLALLNQEKDAQKAFDLSDQNKSVLLLQTTKSEETYHLGALPDSLVWLDKKMHQKQSLLEAKLLEQRSDKEKDSLRLELIKTNQKINAFVLSIKNNFPKYHHLKYQEIISKVEQIQALLVNKTALLEYVISDSILHVFYVDKTTVKWVQQVINKSQLEDKIKNFHQVLSDYNLLKTKETASYKKYTDLAHWFYQNLIQPILKDNKDIANLIVVTDGALGHLPFETFLCEAAPQTATNYAKLHYLMKDYSVSYNYSATLFLESKEKNPSAKKTGQLLAMAANYTIKLDSTLLASRLPTDQWLRTTLHPLPAAIKEVETLEKEFNGFFAFGKDASEKNIKKMAPNYAVIHLAMHGLLDANRPVLSSLAFTEDSDSLESNFWQAHEISKLQLNADLVVLSACETGYGKFEEGNGIASLARAFMYAGAASLIVSLWQVNDYATSEIMKNLYNNLADGMQKDEALRQAKLQYIATAKGILAHPAFWSPFIQIGNTDAITLTRKGGSWAWGIGFGLIVLVGLGIWGLKNRQK